MRLPVNVRAYLLVVVATWFLQSSPDVATAQGPPVVPGTGKHIECVSDDFEADDWHFEHRHPKSSREQDDQVRGPRGTSKNRIWIEGPERGQPDQIETVPTPSGGLVGSRRALLLRTLLSGIPGTRTMDVQQDDLICECVSVLGTTIPVAETPSFTVRIFLPTFDEWENRTGPQFGVRMSVSTTLTERKGGLFARTETTSEPYWPGMWIHFRSETDRKYDRDSAYIAYRGNRLGQDVKIREIEEPGWWTFGMSVTGDGAVHYYASAGVDELTRADHLTSQFPYGYRAEHFRTYFFDSCNRNDGRSWSTPIVIDDPKLYVVNAQRIESLVERRKAAEQRREARRASGRQRR